MNSTGAFVIQETAIEFAGSTFVASTRRSLFHEESRLLLISDCHFGKAAHFRKHHIPIPRIAGSKDYATLSALIARYKPETCMFLGDLFHSDHNAEWAIFEEFIKLHPQTRFHLITGNHDILPEIHYEKAGIALSEDFHLNGIRLTHEPDGNDEDFNICGHIHPGFGLSGKGRQHLSLPCFYISGKRMIMPAFGSLTGHVKMNDQTPGTAFCFTAGAFFKKGNP